MPYVRRNQRSINRPRQSSYRRSRTRRSTIRRPPSRIVSLGRGRRVRIIQRRRR